MKKIHTLTFILASIMFISATIDLNDLFHYESQHVPSYINKDNTESNVITDEGATLGRVLFYDKNLSINNSTSCGTCHKQEFAFSDTSTVSAGFDGQFTFRHSPRLVNLRFGTDKKMFWDERAATLEELSSAPIKSHIELGFSGTNGNPTFQDLIEKLEAIDYYEALFTQAFGSPEITETKIQFALSQFMRSIQSFDSKYDVGLATAGIDFIPFPNFTSQENRGKFLFNTSPFLGGAGCQSCHRAPEFDIDPNSKNNNIVGVTVNPNAIDVNNTRSPTLRDLVNPSGNLNGPMMHDGSIKTLAAVIDHYDDIDRVPDNNNLDARLAGIPFISDGQRLFLSNSDKAALASFLKTLTGSKIYTEEKWSDPFDANGNLDWTPIAPTTITLEDDAVTVIENPLSDYYGIKKLSGLYTVQILDEFSNVYQNIHVTDNHTIHIKDLPDGLFYLNVKHDTNQAISFTTILKNY